MKPRCWRRDAVVAIERIARVRVEVLRYLLELGQSERAARVSARLSLTKAFCKFCRSRWPSGVMRSAKANILNSVTGFG